MYIPKKDVITYFAIVVRYHHIIIINLTHKKIPKKNKMNTGKMRSMTEV
jgi:hypothetical protein